MSGKVILMLDRLKKLKEENQEINTELKILTNEYFNKINNFDEFSESVFLENEKSINDFKTIFKNAYKTSFKKITETFDKKDDLFFNKGFFVDEEKEAIYFKENKTNEVEYEYYRINGKEIVFFLKEETEINTIKIITKDNNGVNLIPKEIIINNSIGNSYFLEDFNRFFEYKDNEYDIQTFISNPKSIKSIKFIFDEIPNMVFSTFKFFLNEYENENEVIVKFKNLFKKNKIIKIQKNIYDKYNILKYFISFNGVDFEEFNFVEEDESLQIDNDKIITLPENNVSEFIFIKILSDKKNVDISNTKRIISTKNYIEQIVPKDFLLESKDKYKYKLDNHNGVIVPGSLKIYLSNKFSKLISDINSELIDIVTEKGKNKITEGYINKERIKLENDDKFFLYDFDSLESLKSIDKNLGFLIGDNLYLPMLFFEENIYFRISYDVEFSESGNINTYSPFLFDISLMGGE